MSSIEYGSISVPVSCSDDGPPPYEPECGPTRYDIPAPKLTWQQPPQNWQQQPHIQQQNWQQQPLNVPQTNTIVIQQAPQVAVHASLRDTPVRTVCPFCSASVVTSVNFEIGSNAIVWCVGMFLLFCICRCELGCCFIPFCMDSCKDTVHSCPNCHMQIGTWER
ncbi:hypothetical protein LSAT2_009593 [Lamellibrachia satsuma]|nr:hypothetical protein LSAT2_009593 [Lamellibrachia satsuma]